MPDFHALLREHFSRASLPPAVEEELVSHLTDLYDAAIARGLDGERALDVARNQLGDPTRLLRAVRQYKEGFMPNFPRHVLVPGLFATALTTLTGNVLDVYRLNHLFTAEHFLSRGRYLWSFGPPTPRSVHEGLVNIDLPLLIVYLFAGSLAAFLCMHLGGDRRRRIWASLVPAAVLLFLSCGTLGMEFASLAASWHVMVPIDRLCWLLSECLLSSAILPATALLIGAAPFLTKGTHQPRLLSTL